MSRSVIGRDPEGRVIDIEIAGASGPVGGGSGGSGEQGPPGPPGDDGADGAPGTPGSPGTTLHSGLSDVTADQHHAQNHAARHVTGQPDALTPANIGAAGSGHNHDAAYAPTHSHPYANTSHAHVDADIPAGIARDTEVTTAVTNHEQAANPHSTYATDADLTTHAGTPHGGSIDWGEVGDIVASAFADTAAAGALDEAARADHRHSREANPLTAHEGAADPHTGYLKESDVQGSGGASAFGDTAAAGSAATASRTDHRHSREANPVTAHEAAGDPHPGYLTPTEGNAAYQPLDSDLTAIAALSTTAFGRGLLALADTAALAANHSHGAGAAPVFANLGTALALALATNDYVKASPSATGTFTTTVPAAGYRRTVTVIQTNTTAKTMTFGTGFKPAATLVLGTTANRQFSLEFISDGTNLIETSRTAAIVV